MKRKIYLSTPDICDLSKKYVDEAFINNWVSTVGNNIDKLEQYANNYFKSNTVAVSSGTAAIHLALRVLGIGERDKVITPTLSFIASAAPILYNNAIPIFIDSEKTSWNLDPNLLYDYIEKCAKSNKLPKAIIVVHLFGQAALIEDIVGICRRYNIHVIEDVAESLGATYNKNKLGNYGDVSILSFNGNKIITGSTGGMLITKDRKMANKARYLSQQAISKDPLGVKNYHHVEIGYNYRMSNIVAGIIRGQFKKLKKRVVSRRNVFNRYNTSFQNIDGIYPQEQISKCYHSRWLSCFTIDKKKFGISSLQLIKKLGKYNIESRPVWKPMHLQPVFYRYDVLGGSVAKALNQTGICLPSSSNLNINDQEFVIEKVVNLSNCIKK